VDISGRRRRRETTRLADRAAAGAAVGLTVLALAGGVAGAAPAAATTTAVAAEVAPGAVPVGSRVVFVGDYETGDFSQWEGCQSAVTNSDCTSIGQGNRTMRIVSGAEAHQGRHAARFDLGPGDVPDFGGGERSEVRSDAAGAVVGEGDERWYQWSMQFPEDFRNPTGGWFIVMQWHAGSGSPPLAINVNDDGQVEIGGDGVRGPKKALGPVRRGQWVDYTLHAKFSRDAGEGFVEGWENGRQTVPRTNRATMTSDSNYLKQGIYRDTGPRTSIVMDGLRVTAP
jgi:hypothetical protein